MATVRSAAGSFAAALLLAVWAAVVGMQPAHGRVLAAVDLGFSFPAMTTGETRSESRTVSIPVPAVLEGTETTISDPDDAFDWDVSLCLPDGGACIAVTPSVEGAELAAGDYTLTMAVTLRDGTPEGVSSSVQGRLAFVEQSSAAGPGDEELAQTGVSGEWLMAAVGLLAGTGLVLIIVARRRTREEATS